MSSYAERLAAAHRQERGVEAIRVVVCDDHELFRKGLRMVLEQEEDIEVVGEAASGPDAVKLISEQVPDVALLDVRMPGGGGISAAQQVKQLAPSVKIVMLTVSDEEADLFDAVKSGAVGYLLKEIAIDEVPAAIRSVHGGQSLISPAMASKLLSEFATLVRRSETATASGPRLTDREVQVLKLVAKGLSNRDVAKELTISENTVKNHMRNILEKLQLHSRVEAVMYAVRERILTIE